MGTGNRSLQTGSFLSSPRNAGSWESVKPYFDDLLHRNIGSPEALEQWLIHRSELLSWLEEELAWRYIRMNCDTSREELAKSYEDFVTHIEPHIQRYNHQFDKIFLAHSNLSRMEERRFSVLFRAAKKRIGIYREENIPLMAELQVEEQEYGKIISEIMVVFRGKEYTLPRAANFLRETDRGVREEVYRLIQKERMARADALQEIFSRLIRKRYKIAINAGYHNYRDFRFDELGRFDYTPDDCMRFHESVQLEVLPYTEKILERKKNLMGLEVLRPWDLEVDPEGLPSLVPAGDAAGLLEKTILCFSEIREEYGNLMRQLAGKGFLDLESRKAKAPGGFNYPLYETNVPFIFMNASGNLRDLETIVHEGGHAIHSFLSGDLELVDFKNLPAEVAELASMSMELISMEHWEVFFPDPDELRRAKIHQLEGIVEVLPWIAAVDEFQHWVYMHPEHADTERLSAWNRIYRRFGPANVSWKDLEEAFVYTWQKQLHIFEIPFYYIEYGIAQLGAIAVWKSYREDPSGTLDRFESALKLGYSRPIPEIYREAGISFDFSPGYIRELFRFVWQELESLYR